MADEADKLREGVKGLAMATPLGRLAQLATALGGSVKKPVTDQPAKPSGLGTGLRPETGKKRRITDIRLPSVPRSAGSRR